jgi:hypothetical protein
MTMGEWGDMRLTRDDREVGVELVDEAGDHGEDLRVAVELDAVGWSKNWVKVSAAAFP